MVLLGKPKSVKTIPSYQYLKLIYLAFNTWYKDDLLKHSKMLYEKGIWDLMHKKTYTLSINRQRMTKKKFHFVSPTYDGCGTVYLQQLYEEWHKYQLY